eukprot:m.30012 g.30012  ORF g.30012 m.30012 type:complete len:56 (-) comp14457_c0_seq1:17-184(-)
MGPTSSQQIRARSRREPVVTIAMIFPWELAGPFRIGSIFGPLQMAQCTSHIEPGV